MNIEDLMDDLQEFLDDEQQQGGGGGGAGGGAPEGQEDEQDQQGGASADGAGDPTNETGNDTKGNGATPLEELSDRQKKQLEKALAKQKDFQDGETKKTKLNKKDQKQLDAVKNSDASVEKVETPSYYGGGTEETEVVVIRKINEATKGLCGMFGRWDDHRSKEAVTKGLQLGAMLGKKLQIRNDDITTQFNRQRKGKVDKRLLADLGVGNSKIFEQSFVTTANDAGIHISIDASGSMGGTRWENALKTAVAIAKAADVVGGIRVRIDVRSIDHCELSGGRNRWGVPVVLVAYDSKVNKLTHIRKYFPYLSVSGGTPEGLCFEAIKDIIQQGGKDTDRYFINMSDGAPSGNYVDLTAKAVKKFKQSGMRVLSYFIGNGTSRNSTFDRMYGKDAAYVDTNNITQIAKTLNKLLSERG
jgi:hypothetical protein